MRVHAGALLLVVGMVLATYSNTLRNGFVGDDHLYVENNPFLRGQTHGPAHLAGNRPVFLASLMADRAVWGERAAGYHATNVLLHCANSAWVYALGLALGAPAAAGFWAALLFGLHPIQTEAVNAVSYRPDLLATFFFLFSLWVYLQARARPRGKMLVLLLAAALLYALGLLSKEMALTLPGVALLAEGYFPRPQGRRARLLVSLSAFSLVLCAWAGFGLPRLRYPALGAASGLRQSADRLAQAMPTAPAPGGRAQSPAEKVHAQPPASWQWSDLRARPAAFSATMVTALGDELRLLAVPAPLVADRAPRVVGSWKDPRPTLAVLALALAALFAVCFRLSAPTAAFGAAWCLATLLPVSNLIPLFNPVAERYLYLVFVGAALAAGSLLSRLLSRGDGRVRALVLLGAALLAAACALRTHARNRDWRSDETLFLDPEYAPLQGCAARYIRGNLLREAGLTAAAEAEYRQALFLNPREGEA